MSQSRDIRSIGVQNQSIDERLKRHMNRVYGLMSVANDHYQCCRFCWTPIPTLSDFLSGISELF